MPKPIDLRRVLRVLSVAGFILVSQKGSHAKFRRPGFSARTVIVKMTSKQVPYGTFCSILLQSGLTEEEFRK